MSVPAYPGEIRSLTSLRYLAAAWVVIHHFAHFTGSVALQDFPLIASGYLGVDFFFVLSGFVLTHVYQAQVATGRFDYWMFVAKRFARIYPMHLVMLGVFILIGLGTRYAGVEVSRWISGTSFRGVDDALLLRGLIANLTLIHAWGSTSYLMFNQPSWSISAEWFAYLLFPVLILLRRLPPRREGAKLIVVALIFLGMALAYQALLANPLTRLTWNVGILRIFPEFLLGMSLHRFGEGWSAGRRGAPIGLLLSVVWTIVVLLATGPLPGLEAPLAGAAVLGLAGIVLFAADADRHGAMRAAGGRVVVYLGEISYSVYMVHLAIGILLYDIVAPRWRPDDVPTALATALAGLALATLVSMATYRLVEVPGRRWIVARARGLQPAPEPRHAG